MKCRSLNVISRVSKALFYSFLAFSCCSLTAEENPLIREDVLTSVERSKESSGHSHKHSSNSFRGSIGLVSASTSPVAFTTLLLFQFPDSLIGTQVAVQPFIMGYSGTPFKHGKAELITITETTDPDAPVGARGIASYQLPSDLVISGKLPPGLYRLGIIGQVLHPELLPQLNWTFRANFDAVVSLTNKKFSTPPFIDSSETVVINIAGDKSRFEIGVTISVERNFPNANKLIP